MEGDPASMWGAILGQGRDIRGTKSDAHVLNSGLGQAQPIKRVGAALGFLFRGSIRNINFNTIGNNINNMQHHFQYHIPTNFHTL